MMPKYFWFLSAYSARPDGGTQMILEHHRHLLLAGRQSYIVYQGGQIIWSDHRVKNIINLWDAIKNIGPYDYLISSWDDIILGLFKTLKVGRKVAFLQSHFANIPQRYTTGFETITVSNFARNYIFEHYGTIRKVLPNVVRIPDGIKTILFNNKKDKIVTARPRRDLDVLTKFISSWWYKNYQIQVMHQWYDRKTFINKVNDRKLYLSFYRQDAFGLPPVEAMSLGTVPIIISNSTGMDYRSDGANSFVYAPDDLQKGQANIRRDVWNRQERLPEISRRGVCTASRYDMSNILEVLP